MMFGLLLSMPVLGGESWIVSVVGGDQVVLKWLSDGNLSGL